MKPLLLQRCSFMVWGFQTSYFPCQVKIFLQYRPLQNSTVINSGCYVPLGWNASPLFFTTENHKVRLWQNPLSDMHFFPFTARHLNASVYIQMNTAVTFLCCDCNPTRVDRVTFTDHFSIAEGKRGQGSPRRGVIWGMQCGGRCRRLSTRSLFTQ